jgi:endonuclease YncB( thermonuclease family)
MKNTAPPLFACTLVFGLMAPCWADTACEPAQITRVVDGDTLIVGGSERVRLSEVDAPETNQAFGTEARLCLDSILAVAPPSICRQGQDQYGRTLANLQVSGVDVGAALVTLGCAWAYTAYLPQNSALPSMQQAAASQSNGLWALSAPQAPWRFRAGDTPPTPQPGAQPLHPRVFAWLEQAFPEHTTQPQATAFDGFGWTRCYSALCASYRAGAFWLLDAQGDHRFGAGTLAGPGDAIGALAADAGF